jgi:hypothetical protein
VLERGLRNLRGAEESFPDLEIEQLRADLAVWQAYLFEAPANHEKHTGEVPAEQFGKFKELHTPPLPKVGRREY